MNTGGPIERLSNELLRLILDQIEPDPDRTIPIESRGFLSVESFDRPLPSTRGSIKDVGRFRCACKRFADVGEPLLYTRVAARFSKRGLQKLEQLAAWPHLARHVKKFSYLVPYFYNYGRLVGMKGGVCTNTYRRRGGPTHPAGSWRHSTSMGLAQPATKGQGAATDHRISRRCSGAQEGHCKLHISTARSVAACGR